jgi:hypothetical protein
VGGVAFAAAACRMTLRDYILLAALIDFTRLRLAIRGRG